MCLQIYKKSVIFFECVVSFLHKVAQLVNISQKLPKTEVEKALKLKNEYYERKKNGTL